VLGDHLGRDLLQAKDGHQAGVGAGHDLDHHLQDRLRQVHPAIFPGQRRTDDVGLP
jgi:hypothetical protein